MDGKPTRLFLLIVVRTVPEHLGILARISRLLRNPELRHQLLAATTPQAVVAAVREAEMKLG